MHLDKPTVFVKDGFKRTAYFTVEAREFRLLGWEEESKVQEKKAAKPKPAEKPARKSSPLKKLAEQIKPSEEKSDG